MAPLFLYHHLNLVGLEIYFGVYPVQEMTLSYPTCGNAMVSTLKLEEFMRKSC